LEKCWFLHRAKRLAEAVNSGAPGKELFLCHSELRHKKRKWSWQKTPKCTLYQRPRIKKSEIQQESENSEIFVDNCFNASARIQILDNWFINN
jgi:hypothetical protein